MKKFQWVDLSTIPSWLEKNLKFQFLKWLERQKISIYLFQFNWLIGNLTKTKSSI